MNTELKTNDDFNASPEFTKALVFVLDYREGKISDEYATTSSLAQMLVDYNQWQLEQNQVSAGVWVRASERLPEKMKKFNGRFEGRAVIVEYTNILDGYITVNGNIEKVGLVEWLDESALQQKQVPVITDEEIEKLAEKEYPDFKSVSPFSALNDLRKIQRADFIIGFKAALQQSSMVNSSEAQKETIKELVEALDDIQHMQLNAGVIDYKYAFNRCLRVATDALQKHKEQEDRLKQSAQQSSVVDVWIDVKDRLPDEGGRYWCYIQEQTDLGLSSFQWNCCYHEIEKTWTDNFVNTAVTHWQPLPSPPKTNKRKIT